jgi:threonine aldolase
MRFLAAQMEALLQDELWRGLAAHANEMAARLAAAISELPGITVTHPVESNAVFARLPRRGIEALRAQFALHVWDEARDEVRWMCSWDTTEGDIERLVRAARAVL